MAIDKSMSIVVTGSNGLVGRALLDRLKETEAKVIAISRHPVELPVQRVITATLDAPTSAAALKSADTVVHLAGVFYPMGKDTYQTGNVEAAATVAGYLKNSKKKQRILFLSQVGAGEESKNVFFRTKAMAERLLAAAGKEMVIFRCTHIVGSPKTPGPLARSLLAKPGKKASALGSGQQMLAPVYLGDVVSALIAAVEGESTGIYELAGPDTLCLDDLVRLLNRNPEIRIKHVSARMARLLGSVFPWLPGPFVDAMLQDCVGNSYRAVSTFGLKLTSLRTIWR